MAFNVIKPHIAMNLQKSYLMKDSIDVTLESSLNKDDPIIIDTCVKKKTGILKVLHGNTKSPTGCMYSWKYNILLQVKEGI